jgi:hypothetical protein
MFSRETQNRRPNEPHVAKPAMALEIHAERLRRGLADAEHSAEMSIVR